MASYYFNSRLTNEFNSNTIDKATTNENSVLIYGNQRVGGVKTFTDDVQIGDELTDVVTIAGNLSVNGTFSSAVTDTLKSDITDLSNNTVKNNKLITETQVIRGSLQLDGISYSNDEGTYTNVKEKIDDIDEKTVKLDSNTLQTIDGWLKVAKGGVELFLTHVTFINEFGNEMGAVKVAIFFVADTIYIKNNQNTNYNVLSELNKRLLLTTDTPQTISGGLTIQNGDLTLKDELELRDQGNMIFFETGAYALIDGTTEKVIKMTRKLVVDDIEMNGLITGIEVSDVSGLSLALSTITTDISNNTTALTKTVNITGNQTISGEKTFDSNTNMTSISITDVLDTDDNLVIGYERPVFSNNGLTAVIYSIRERRFNIKQPVQISTLNCMTPSAIASITSVVKISDVPQFVMNDDGFSSKAINAGRPEFTIEYWSLPNGVGDIRFNQPLKINDSIEVNNYLKTGVEDYINGLLISSLTAAELAYESQPVFQPSYTSKKKLQIESGVITRMPVLYVLNDGQGNIYCDKLFAGSIKQLKM